MKFALASDLHLEFSKLELFNTENADVLVLSGDILVASSVDKFKPMMEQYCGQFKEVVYVLGNHEHYKGDYATTYGILKKELDFSNLHLLENETFTYGDVTFVGFTLWTDMNKNDPNTMFHLKNSMNDFRIIQNSNQKVAYKDANGNFKNRFGKFKPEDAYDAHKVSIDYLASLVSDKTEQKFVVVGHHAPSKLSVKPRYQRDHMMNGGYSSDLSEFILDHPQIKFWTHGHTHDEFDYEIGDTRIICNPRGYDGWEDRSDYFRLKYYEV